MLSEACRNGSCIAAAYGHGCLCSDDPERYCTECQRANSHPFVALLDAAQDEVDTEKQCAKSESSNSVAPNERENTMDRFLDELRSKSSAVQESIYELDQRVSELEDAKGELEGFQEAIDNLISAIEDGLEDVSVSVESFEFDSSEI